MKLAIVTGTSRGLGRAAAETLIHQKYHVMGMGRSQPKGFPKTDAYDHLVIDLAEIQTGAVLLKTRLEKLCSPEVSEVCFIHNASFFGPVGMLPTLTPEDTLRGIQVNLTSAIILSQILLEVLSDKGIPLKMIYISSPAAVNAIPGANLYCIAKAGIEMLARGIESEAKYFKGSVKSIAFRPGRIDTDMQAEIRNYSKDQFPLVERYREFHRTDQLRSAESVARVLCDELVKKDVESGRIYSIDEFVF